MSTTVWQRLSTKALLGVRPLRAIQSGWPVVFSVSLVLLSSRAFAWPPEIAAELNFFNEELEDAWSRQKDITETHNRTSFAYQKRFRKAVEGKCPECAITEMKDRYGIRKYRVTLPEQWYFDITLDPGVLEITSHPINEDVQIKLASKLDSLIWGTASEIGLQLDTTGHLNLGVESTFGKDSLLFANTLTDYLNHVGLFKGALMGFSDTANAPHPEELAKDQSAALRRILAEFDPKTETIEVLAKRIYDKVYFKSTTFGGADGEPHEKYHAINVTSIAEPGTPWPRVELRAMPMQGSAHELLLLSRMFRKRIELLKKRSDKVEYTAHLRFPPSDVTMVEQFYRYVTESGLDWADYRGFVPAKLRRALSRVEKKVGFRSRIGAVAPMCRSLF